MTDFDKNKVVRATCRHVTTPDVHNILLPGTGFWGKMSPIIHISEVKAKIMDFEVGGVFNVLNDVTRGHCNIFDAWLKSATPIFDFQEVTNFNFPIKIYWVLY